MKVYYCIDGATKFTDPFWDIICDDCGYGYWSVTVDGRCPKCRSNKGKVLNNKHIKVDLSKYSKHR